MEEKYTVYCVHSHWDLIKGFNPSQTLFCRKEHDFLDKNGFQKIINLVLLMKMQCILIHVCLQCTVYSEQCTVYSTVYMCAPWNPSLYTRTGQAGYGRRHFPGKDDCCDRTMAIYVNYLYILYNSGPGIILNPSIFRACNMWRLDFLSHRSNFHLNLRVVERLEKSPVKVQAPEKLSGVKKVRGWVTEEFSIRSPLL